MLIDYAKLAVKNLRHRQLRSWLTMIGIFIGIATVVALISLGAGLKAAIANQFNSLGTDRLVISAKGGDFGPPGQNTAVEVTEKDLAVIQRSANVRIATGRLLEPAQIEFNDKKNVEFVASLPDDPQERDLILEVQNTDPVVGRYPKRTDGYRVALGSNFAKKDNGYDKPVHVGDNILINGKKVEVVGILESRGNPQFDSSVIMNEGPMRELLNISDRYSMLVAEVASQEAVPQAKAAIEKDLRASRNVKERKEDFTVETSDDVIASFGVIIDGVTAVLIGIAAISLLVGGIGIMNTMYTAVLERTREIGIMKAVGATNEAVLSIFLMESGVLGLTGGAIGVLIGYLLGKLVEFAGAQALGPGIIQAQVTFPLVFGALAFSFLVGAIAGTFPAYEASKLPPVEALRQ
jgi:putative ABC transport system permease protein